MIHAADVREWRNRDVVDNESHKIDVLEAVYVDTTTDEPAMATARTGPPAPPGFRPPSGRDRRARLSQGRLCQDVGEAGPVDSVRPLYQFHLDGSEQRADEAER
jgi:hypothetical protein